MTETKHGSMDTSAQQATFSGFLRVLSILAVGVIGVLIFLALVNA